MLKRSAFPKSYALHRLSRQMLLLMAFSGAVTVVRAATVQPASANGSVGDQFYGFSVTTFGTYTYGSISSVSLQGAPIPSVTAYATEPTGYAVAGGSVSYGFAVAGPSDVMVPLLVSVTLRTDAQADPGSATSGYARVYLQATGGIYDESVSCQVDACAHNTLFDIVPLLMQANDFDSGLVSLQANATASGGTAMAYADPVFTIDPSFADAALYSIVLPEGIANGDESAVPEPSTCLLAPLALIGIFGVSRFRNAVARRRSA